MNKFIENELKKCEVAEIEQVSATEFNVKKKKNILDLIKVNFCYIIKLENYIINPNENFTLHVNWNNGVIPKSQYMKVIITQIMGKMIKIDGCGFDFDSKVDLKDSYLGLWLPLGGIKIMQELR